MRPSIQRILGMTVMAFFAFGCQNFQEESPVMNQFPEENSAFASSEFDPNARKGNFPEFGAFLTGSEEVPAVNSPGAGAARISQIDANTLKFEIRVANTSGIAAAHLHLASAGMNGPVVVSLFSAPSPTGLVNGVVAEGMIVAADLVGPFSGKTIRDLIKEFEAGKIYVNLHTSTNPGGELRGQVSGIMANENKNYNSKLSGANEVPAVSTSATGIAKFNFNQDTSMATFQVNVDGLSDVRFAHIHFAKAGVNGPVVYTLRMDKVEGPVSGVYAKGEIMPSMFSGKMTGGDLIILREAFRTGNAYVNVHTDQFPGGELRGQIN
ncbi:CHRD domain-containing protein [Algoriphagus mannitolivorans]|uniref:CHRD domain-containing protein n=1 Tax=Algoriphagus mannitolivorans TaxID=226504 RepID=UPI0003FB9B97|nr:CHRD domain-containing protein [Algoriphagus mannitolivorans]